jgi:hypothetical protein
MGYFYQKTTLEVGRPMAQTDIETIESLPIKDTTTDNKQRIIRLVTKLLDEKKNDSSKSKDIEDDINNYIFDIYQITKEERDMIMRDIK